MYESSDICSVFFLLGLEPKCVIQYSGVIITENIFWKDGNVIGSGYKF